MSKHIKVALMGNPNTGKTSLFNILTGLNQKVANYPGITVEKKMGHCVLPEGKKADIIDLPGTYSLNANSADEKVAVKVLLEDNDSLFPDVVVVVTDVENLKQNLLIFTQIKDLRIPTLLVINMVDQMQKKGIEIDLPALEEELQTKIILTSSRTRQGIEALKQALVDYKNISLMPCVNVRQTDKEYFNLIEETFPTQNAYKIWLLLSHNTDLVQNIALEPFHSIKQTRTDSQIRRMKHKETIIRYQFINNTLRKHYQIDHTKAQTLRTRLDRVLMHKVWGYVIFCCILALIFQAIYEWSVYPMDWIDQAFGFFAQWTSENLPEGPLSDLIANGIIPGIGGIAVFIPQIAMLFLFIAILEESGYMSRVVFLMDNIMKRFGLSGKSVVPLISGMACAIPAVMVARNIENWKERLLTILVTPFMTCSARLPVYLIIIALVIPEGNLFFISYKALTLFLLYFLGFAMALLSAFILNKTLKIEKNKSFFIVEMPNYKSPQIRNVVITMYEKTKNFVFGAGKIILSISVILWFLASHGLSEPYQQAESYITQKATTEGWNEEETNHHLEAYQLEHSLLGTLGKTIEPIFRPLGYDWKISIGVLASFAAREVFISTLASVYSLGGDLDFEDESGEKTIITQMRNEKRTDGTPVFSLATGVSLLLFYAFSMQCLSTMAIVKKETNSWRWTTIQWAFMGGLAYFSAMIAYIFI